MHRTWEWFAKEYNIIKYLWKGLALNIIQGQLHSLCALTRLILSVWLGITPFSFVLIFHPYTLCKYRCTVTSSSVSSLTHLFSIHRYIHKYIQSESKTLDVLLYQISDYYLSNTASSISQSQYRSGPRQSRTSILMIGTLTPEINRLSFYPLLIETLVQPKRTRGSREE